MNAGVMIYLYIMGLAIIDFSVGNSEEDVRSRFRMALNMFRSNCCPALMVSLKPAYVPVLYLCA